MYREQSAFKGLQKNYTATFLKETIRTRSAIRVRDMSRTQESLNRQKVSKSLQFGTGEATTCTSSANSSYQDFSSWKRPVPAYLPGFLSPIQSQLSHLLSAFLNQNMASPRSAHAFLPGVTSTPRSSGVQEQSEVQLKIQYPTKNVSKSLTVHISPLEKP